MVRYHLFLLPAFRDPEEKVHDRLTICTHACKHASNSLICPNDAFYVLQRDYVRPHSYRRITAYLRSARYRIRSVIQAAHKSIWYMGIQKLKAAGSPAAFWKSLFPCFILSLHLILHNLTYHRMLHHYKYENEKFYTYQERN